MPSQFVMFGLEGAGKTTLFFRLKISKWKDLTKDLKSLGPNHDLQKESEDPGYHYDEVDTCSQMGHVGLWDVPGNDAMIEMWPMFYRYVPVVAVLFVVDGGYDLSEELSAEEDEEERKKRLVQIAESTKNLEKARDLITRLLNEEELRLAAFVLIINDKREEIKVDRSNPESAQRKEKEEQEKEQWGREVADVLGVAEFTKSHGDKFRYFTLNLAEFKPDIADWGTIMTHVRTVYVESGRETV